MAWKPKRSRESLPPETEVVAEIVKVEKKQSKRGNEMVAMEYRVECNGKTHKLMDWIVAGFSAWKAQAIRMALGKGPEGFRLSNQIGARLYVRIGHREPQGEYGWSAEIAEYLVPGPSGPPAPALHEEPQWPEPCPY